MTPDREKLPSYYCFSRMAKKFGALKMVEMVDTTTDDVYLYRVTRKDGTFFYVAWYRKDNLDCYDAQKQAAKSICLPIYFRQAKVTSIYGDTDTISGEDQGLVLELTVNQNIPPAGWNRVGLQSLFPFPQDFPGRVYFMFFNDII